MLERIESEEKKDKRRRKRDREGNMNAQVRRKEDELAERWTG
jgi:hypothetical protein